MTKQQYDSLSERDKIFAELLEKMLVQLKHLSGSIDAMDENL